jgi:hypothetical protein
MRAHSFDTSQHTGEMKKNLTKELNDDEAYKPIEVFRLEEHVRKQPSSKQRLWYRVWLSR